ncbi:Nucleoporin [Exophiala dermatitidis]
MFSPEASRPQSLRPKRTRQAAGQDDSVKLPQAKRKRSALRKDTFEPLTEASINEVAGRETNNEKGHENTTQASTVRDLALRGGKKHEKRATGSSNAALILSNNEFYTVAQLPALPDQIRNRPNLPYSFVLSPEYGYALALTHTDAIIWPYHSSASTPSSRDVVTFKLPFPPASVDDPLPLATFTARAASGEPGIVAVSAKLGKVVYWETISSATSLLPGQASSVQGSIPGMQSNEAVEEIVNAEPSGFILTLRHGRAAHLTIRDQMGRPGIGVQFLRKPTNGAAGLFGSIRHVFGGDRRKGTPIVKAGGSRKGQRDIVIATQDAELELWSTTLSSGNTLEASFGFKDEIVEALRAFSSEDGQLQFEILDVELSAGPSTTLARRESHGAPMMVLASLSTSGQTRYFLIEMLVDQGAKVRVVHPITSYSSPNANQQTWRPRLCVARTHPVAFVVFETAIVVFSLAKIRETPSSQLMLERHALPEPFQDAIRFQDDTLYKVLGFALESAEKHTSIVFGVQGFGVVKLTYHPRNTDNEIDVDEVEDRISAKSKIEQAVFFGSMKQNPLDLKSASQSLSAEEVETAALAISSEILSSSSKHLPKSAPSVEMQMRIRAKALDDLAQHLLQCYPSFISRNTRFQLLLNAEKLAAAQAIWKVQEDIQRRYPQDDREMSYLEFTLRALHESRQKYPDPAKGEKDRVRHWLVNSVEHVDHLMSELGDCIRELEPMDVTDPRVVADYFTEAADLWIASYSAAFKFREDNAPHYGLGDEVFKDGVLIAGFPVEIPHPWTSRPEPLRFGQRLVYDICKFLNEWWDFSHGRDKKKKMPTDLDGKPYEGPSKDALLQLADRLPVEVELFSRLVNEESTQAECHLKVLEKDPEILRDEIKAIRNEEIDRLSQALLVISAFNMEGAISLSEKLRYFGMLVNLHYDYYKKLTREVAADPSLEEENQRKLTEMQNRAETYFDRFGKGWALAYFRRLIEDDECGTLLKAEDDEKKMQFLSWFFKLAEKLGQKVGKLSWIHDIVGKGDYLRAEKTLQEVAAEEMDDVWSKKTELSIAKLAALAAAEDSETIEVSSEQYDNELAVIKIQERIYSHVTAVVGPALDEKAAADLANESFATRWIAKYPALKRQLKQELKSLLRQQPLSTDVLVDILTLIDPVAWPGVPEEDPEVRGQEFFLALQVVDLSSFSAAKKDDLRALIWRRAMIRDDWLLLNETSGKDDQRVQSEMQQTSLFQTIEQVLLAGQTEGSDVRFLSPTDILAREAFPSTLQQRFTETELEGLRKDFDKEQAKLKTYVEKGRLEDHFGGLVSSAQRAIRDVMDGRGEQMAQEVMLGSNGLSNGL